MEQFFYTETMTVMNADADFRSLLKPSALLRYVEQVSADHARTFGMTDQFFKDHGVAFLVGKQALKFDRVPQRAEKLTLLTRAEASRRGSVKRITTVTDAEGKQVAMVDCRWIVVSLAENRILREPGWGRWTASGTKRWKASCPCSCTSAVKGSPAQGSGRCATPSVI